MTPNTTPVAPPEELQASLAAQYPPEDAPWFPPAAREASELAGAMASALEHPHFELDWVRDAHDRFDALAPVADARQRSDDFDCHKGCDHCCRIQVVCMPVEVFHIDAWLRANWSAERLAAFDARLRDVADHARAHRDQEDRPNKQCPMLVDGACSIYPARPFMCRGVVSYDVEGCRKRFREDDDEVDVPFGRSRHALASACSMALGHALQSDGLSAGSLDMHIALDIVRSEPATLIRWLSGEDVFGEAWY